MRPAGKVSVIITTCKGTEKLIRAIESVLNQTYSDIEIIVVDDNGLGTADQRRTYKLIQHYINEGKINYIPHEVNKNGAAARNTGLQNSTGEYVAFLDDDDFFLPERCETLVGLIVSSNCDLAYSDVLFLSGKELRAEMLCREQGFTQAELLIDQSLLGTGSNLFMKKSVPDEVNGFDESFQRYQDVEFTIRALASNRIAGINKCLVVKDGTENRFYPKFESLLSAQEHLLSTFKDELSLLTEQERSVCFASKRGELVMAAYQSADGKNINAAWAKYKSDCPESKQTDKLKIKIRGFFIRFFPKVLVKARDRKNERNRNVLLNSLDSGTVKDITMILGVNNEG